MQTKVIMEKMLIAGEWVEGINTFDVRNPQNNELIAKVPAATEKDMNKAIEKAEAAYSDTLNWPTHERMNVINKAVDYIKENMERYAETIASEGSKTINEARGEVRRTIQTLQISAEEARRINGETISFDQREGSENRVG